MLRELNPYIADITSIVFIIATIVFLALGNSYLDILLYLGYYSLPVS